MRFAFVVVAALAGCHPYVSGSYDTSTKVRGPMAPMMGNAQTRSVEVGGGARDFTLGVGLHEHQLSPYVAASGSFDMTWTPVRIRFVSTHLHVGPTFTSLVDRMTADSSYAQGMNYGVGAVITAGPLAVFADWNRSVFLFADGPARGVSTLSAVTFGLRLR